MPKPYSADLRVRVVEAVDEGATRHEAAERFGVSVSSAVRWHQAWRHEGTIEAKRYGGSAHLWRITPRKFLPSSRNNRT
jgi:transposase